jgi:hypothetical protein
MGAQGASNSQKWRFPARADTALTANTSEANPDALIGANFSPLVFFTDPRLNGFGKPSAQTGQHYMPDPNQWIAFLRAGGTNLAW